METIIQFFEDLFDLSTDQQIFVISVLAISVTGLALYVVLAALKNSAGKGGAQ